MLLLRRRNQRRPMPGRSQRPGQRPLVAEPRQPQQRQAMRPMRPKIPRGMQRQAYEQRRKSWAGIFLVGPIIEWVLNWAYRGRRHRVHERTPHRQILKAPGARRRGRLMVDLELQKYGYRRAQGRREAAQRRKAA